MRHSFTRTARIAVTSAIVGAGTLGFAADAGANPTSFTAGDLAVYEVTQTSGAGGVSTAGAVTLVDYSTSGVASGYVVSMPAADSGSGVGSTHRLVESGKATNDGDLTLSADGQYLYATGYDDAVGTASITGVTTVPRTVAIVGVSGGPDTSTAFADSATEAQNFRSATGTTGGSQDFYNGGGAGIGYTADGATANTSPLNIDPGDTTHQLQINNGSLFESNTHNIDQLGTLGTTGLPTGTTTPNPIIPTALVPAGFDPNGYAFATLGSGSLPDTLYVADTANNAVEKYAYNSSTGLVTAAEGSVSVDNPTGLVVSIGSPGAASIYITNGTGSNTWANQISDLTDSSGAGGTLPSNTTIHTLVTAGTSSTFHGLAWAPQSANSGNGLPEAPAALLLPITAALLFGGGFVVYRRRYRVA
jgi:hypothetical protein